jgi:heat shock protein HslJ
VIPRSLALAATLFVACLTLAACSSTPAADLPGSQWTVTSIDGTTTQAEGTPTIEFGSDGAVAGTTGCNRYSGKVLVDGDKITFQSIASTLIGCDDALGAQEQAFIAALDKASNWSIGPNGDLTITGGGNIVARPIEQQPT